MAVHRILAAGLASASLVAVSFAQTTSELIAQDEDDRLAACLELIETDPEAAYEEGLRWLGQGSRPKARYCTALALAARGQYDEAAWRLESLAAAPDSGSERQRLDYLVRAGNAWLAAGNPDEAIGVLSRALEVLPREPGLLVDRASAYLLKGDAERAVGDLNVVLDAEPANQTARILRARAFLETGRAGPALADIEVAREADPENLDILVLRGEIREAQRIAVAE